MDERVIDILLIEDDAGDVELLRNMFDDSNLNSTLHVVGNGEDAMCFLRQEEPFGEAARPHLILLDLNLPHESGYVVLEKVKSDQDMRRIPVIVLTSANSENEVNRAYDLHANSYIIKPIDFDRFVKVMELVKTFWFNIVELPSH
jgi:response regulator RpfG family c-di-GMP phosphodiesterase